MLCVVEEGPCLLQHQLQLHQLSVAALQAVAVAVQLQQLPLQPLQPGLQKWKGTIEGKRSRSSSFCSSLIAAAEPAKESSSRAKKG